MCEPQDQYSLKMAGKNHMFRKWEDLPDYMRTEAVWPYYVSLKKKSCSLIIKRGFDFIAAVCMMYFLWPLFVLISIWIAVDSRGEVFFRQERVTQYGRKFKILKFRTMVADVRKMGSQVTVADDMRVTKAGKILRKYRLDELPQLMNIIMGDMSFVGTRPEVPRFVHVYTEEMMATLLLPAGVTSEASIQYKDESRLLSLADNVDEVYIKQILPRKMEYNLQSIKNFTLLGEVGVMIKTLFKVFYCM